MHAFSFGSESNNLSAAAIDSISSYKTILVWADHLHVAERLAALWPGAIPMTSPDIDGSKPDANDMLQQGTLGRFLTTRRLESAGDCVSLDRLYYDLWDGSQTLLGLEDGTAAVFEEIQHRRALLR